MSKDPPQLPASPRQQSVEECSPNGQLASLGVCAPETYVLGDSYPATTPIEFLAPELTTGIHPTPPIRGLPPAHSSIPSRTGSQPLPTATPSPTSRTPLPTSASTTPYTPTPPRRSRSTRPRPPKSPLPRPHAGPPRVSFLWLSAASTTATSSRPGSTTASRTSSAITRAPCSAAPTARTGHALPQLRTTGTPG